LNSSGLILNYDVVFGCFAIIVVCIHMLASRAAAAAAATIATFFVYFVKCKKIVRSMLSHRIFSI
jgi:hypothetical protein